MSEPVIRATGLGKMYRLYNRPGDKVLDAFGIGKLRYGKTPYYKEFWALRGMDLTINRGERVGFIGRNGAGKSTFLKMVAGTLSATEGSLKMRGKVQALMELGTGFHPEFTGRENIYASLAYQGLSSQQIDKHVDEIIDFSELDEFIDHPVRTYSAGMYARLAFTTSTVLNPEILIIDEILGAGDAYFAGKSLERMRSLTTKTGATILFVSHDVSAVQALCTRAIWIDRGCVVMDGGTIDVVKAYYRAIQKEEALQRQAKQMRIRKAHRLVSLEKEEGGQVLLHLVCDTDHPKYQHTIRKVRLLRYGRPLMELSVGAPMDNKVDAEAAIIDTPGYMDWSPSKKDNTGYYRHYSNQSGRYNHAPFHFVIPGLDFPSPDYQVEIDAIIQPAELVHLEIYWGQQYHRIGTLNPCTTTHHFSLPALNDILEESVPEEVQPRTSVELGHITEQRNPVSVVTWDKPDPCISKAIFVDTMGEEVAGIEELDDLIFEIHYFSSKIISTPVFSMSIWRADGTVLCHANTALAKLTIDRLDGEGKVVFRFPKFRGTSGDYVVGCSIFETLDPMNNVVQRPYYDQHDRAYRFKVWKKLDNAMMLGLVRIEFEVQHGENRASFNNVGC